MDFLRTPSMRIAKVASLDNDKRGSFVVVVDKIDQTWLCSCNFVMSDHPSSPPIPSIDSNLLLPPTSSPIPPSVFYLQSTPNRLVTPPPNASIPTSTPISNKTSGNHGFASETHDRDSANYRLAQETSGLFLGAMPPEEFLMEFLPTSQDTPERPNSKEAFANVSSAKKEVDMYTPFVRRVLCFCTYCALLTFNR
jgi:hypothetical protein